MTTHVTNPEDKTGRHIDGDAAVTTGIIMVRSSQLSEAPAKQRKSRANLQAEPRLVRTPGGGPFLFKNGYGCGVWKPLITSRR